MANPTTYVPSYSFAGFQASNPGRPLPAVRVDDEFASISLSTSELVRSIRDVRRSDGRLNNGIVTKDSLSREVWIDVRAAVEALAPYKDLGAVSIERSPIVSDGSRTQITLSPAPYSPETVHIFIGGSERIFGRDFTIAGATITMSTPIPAGSPAGEVIWHTAAPLISGLPPELVYWDDILSKPLTLSGYGIADAYTKTQVNALIAAIPVGSGGGSGSSVTRPEFTALSVRVDGFDTRISALEETGGTGTVDLKTPVRFSKTDVLRDTGIFEAAGGTFAKAQHLQESVTPYNTSTARLNYLASHLRVVAEGSALNGPHNATVAQGIHLSKENYGTGNARSGEIDGIYINMYQDSPDGVRADGAGILIDNHIRTNTGFMAGVEGMTRVIDANGAEIYRTGYQIGVADTMTVDPLVVGAQLTAYTGVVDYGLIIGSDNAGGAGGYFQYPLQIHNGGRELLRVDAAGNLRLGSTVGPGAKMSLRVSEVGNFGILNDAQSAEVMQVTQTGNLTIAGKLTADSLTVTNFSPSTINMSGSITAGSLASNGNASVSGSLTTNASKTLNTHEANVNWTHYYAFFDAVPSAPAAGGVMFFEAGTGNLKIHNGTSFRTIVTQ